MEHAEEKLPEVQMFENGTASLSDALTWLGFPHSFTLTEAVSQFGMTESEIVVELLRYQKRCESTMMMIANDMNTARKALTSATGH